MTTTMRQGSVLLTCFLLLSSVVLAGSGPTPPKDAVWTIWCQSFAGPMRAAEATQARDAMERLTGWREWWLLHQEDSSTLYYGFYRAIDREAEDGKERREAARAHSELERIRKLADGDQNRLFATPLLVQIPNSTTEGPSEWDLRNAPADAYWTLLIGVYRDHPDRKKTAVEAVRQLRKEGVQAFYLHGASSTTICVGAWPRSALKEQESDHAEAPEKDVEVMYIGVPLPKNAPREYINARGKKVRIFAPQIEIQDASLEQAINKHPYFYVNGEVFGRKVTDPKTKIEDVLYDRSSLLVIPRRQTGILDQATPAGPLPDLLEQVAPSDKRPREGGRLRRLED